MTYRIFFAATTHHLTVIKQWFLTIMNHDGVMINLSEPFEHPMLVSLSHGTVTCARLHCGPRNHGANAMLHCARDPAWSEQMPRR